MWCKKKSGIDIGKLIGFMLAIFGAATAVFLVYKCVKKHLPCLCNKKKQGEDWCDLGLDDALHFGCQVPNDDNDLKSEENSVVNSENRMLNIENET